MEEQVKNAAISGQTAIKEMVADKSTVRQKKQSGPFQPAATVLLDVRPIEEAKPAEQARQESPEEMLKQLLINTESSAQRTQFSRRKWQLASLILGMVLVPAVAVIGWLYSEMNAAATQRGRLQMEKQTLNEQLTTAGAQITGFQNEMESLLSRNIELATENAGLKSQGITLAGAITPSPIQKALDQPITQKSAAVTEQAIDAGRVEAIKKGKYPSGTTRAELVTALGEPNRVYKSLNYEQLVYFGRKPGRFWFIGNSLVQTSQ